MRQKIRYSHTVAAQLHLQIKISVLNYVDLGLAYVAVILNEI